MPMTEPLATFFNTTEHGSTAYFDGSTTAINVILDAEYVDPFDGDTASTRPEAMGRTVDFTSVENAIDKNLIIGTTTYRIRNARPDLSGDVLTLELERQGYL